MSWRLWLLVLFTLYVGAVALVLLFLRWGRRRRDEMDRRFSNRGMS